MIKGHSQVTSIFVIIIIFGKPFRQSFYTFPVAFIWLHVTHLIPTPVVLAWRVPGMGELGGLLSMGLHRVGHE